MAKRRKSEETNDEQLVDIVEAKEQTGDFFENNKNLILGVIFLLIAAVVGFLVYKYMFQQPKMEAAKAAIYQAEKQFQRDSFALALENPGADAEGFLDIIDNYGGTPTANLAKLYSGISYLNLGRYEDAIDYLNSYSASGTYGPIVKNGNLGDAHSELGNLDKAMSFYSKATSVSEDALLTPYYLYKLGLLAKRNGDNSKAVSALEKIKKNYPKSEEARKVDAIIAELSS